VKKPIRTGKKLLILAAILALVLLLVVFFPKNTPKTITYEAKIVGFTQTEGPSPIVGVTMIDVFNVTIQNVGKTDISNMNLTVERLINQTVSTVGSFDYQYQNFTFDNQYQNFTLKPGEALSVRVDFMLNLDEMMSPNQSFLAILRTNDTVLDERYL
jgi:hypothetical protein